jgi:hypothetical protein
MRSPRAVRRFFSLVLFLSAITVASCGSDGNPWCNENCSACPSSSSGSCVGRVGNQCCYCPADSWCATDLKDCKCYKSQPDLSGGTESQSRALSAAEPSANGALEGQTLMCR